MPGPELPRAEVDASERTSQLPSVFEPLRWVRWLGLWAVAAALLGRGVAPALRGLAAERVVRPVEVIAGVLSQGLLLALVGALVVLTSSMLRLPRLPMAYRMAVTALGGIALGLAVPASMARLGSEFSVVLGTVAALAALAGAAQAFAGRSTSLLGVVLALGASGTLTRQAAWGMAQLGATRGVVALGTAARWVALGAMVLQVLLVTVALGWLATRRPRWVSAATMLCSGLGLAVAACVERVGSTMALGPMLASRAALMQLSVPMPPAPLGLRIFLGVTAQLLGLLAISSRREAPAVAGSLALLLVAGLDLDVPLCALAATVAALTSTLAAHDPETLRHPVRYDLQRTAGSLRPGRHGRAAGSRCRCV